MTDMLEWIDSHAHLQHKFPFTAEQYVENARQAGVRRIITVAAEPDSLDTVRDLAEQFPNIYFTTGIHPHEASLFTDALESKMDVLRRHSKCVAIGEIGLDYFYKHSKPDEQIASLKRQLALAIAWKKPVVIHSRDAEPDLLQCLTDYANQCHLPQGPGVIHCFSGSAEFARSCLKLGFYLSFSGIVTFPKSDALRAVLPEVPLDRILVETDAPYLAPVPYRGKINQSAYLIEITKFIAQFKNVKLDALSAATVANSSRIFSL